MWTPATSAISSMRSGASALMPLSRNACWRSKIAFAMRSSVFWRWWTASMNQRADSRRCLIHLRTASLPPVPAAPARRRSSRYAGDTVMSGTPWRVRRTSYLPSTSSTTTSGWIVSAGVSPYSRPGFGSSIRIVSIACLMSSSVQPVARATCGRRLVVMSSRYSVTSDFRSGVSSPSGSSCSSRHSFRSRAPSAGCVAVRRSASTFSSSCTVNPGISDASTSLSSGSVR